MVGKKTLRKYVTGIFQNKISDKTLLVGPYMVDADSAYYEILTAIHSIIDNKREMTPESVIEEIVYKYADDDEKKAARKKYEDGIMVMFGDEDGEPEVPMKELELLHDLILRDWKKRIAKSSVEQMAKALESSTEEPEKTFERLKMVIEGMELTSQSSKFNLERAIQEAIDYATNEGSGIIPYGIKPMDEDFGGMSRGEITVIAGRPGHGKTSFVCQLLINWLNAGLKVLFISKEMPVFRVMHKMMSNMGMVSSRQIKHGIADRTKMDSVGAMLRRFQNRFIIYDDVYKLADIESAVMRIRPDIVIDDFVQLGNMDAGKNRTVEIFEVMNRYKAMAKRLGNCFCLTSQLNRSIEGREDPIPRLSDLAESGAIEQLSSDIFFIFYPYKMTFREEMKNRVIIIGSKTRFGESSKVELGFDGDHMRFFYVPKIRQEGE